MTLFNLLRWSWTKYCLLYLFKRRCLPSPSAAEMAHRNTSVWFTRQRCTLQSKNLSGYIDEWLTFNSTTALLGHQSHCSINTTSQDYTAANESPLMISPAHFNTKWLYLLPFHPHFNINWEVPNGWQSRIITTISIAPQLGRVITTARTYCLKSQSVQSHKSHTPLTILSHEHDFSDFKIVNPLQPNLRHIHTIISQQPSSELANGGSRNPSCRCRCSEQRED